MQSVTWPAQQALTEVYSNRYFAPELNSVSNPAHNSACLGSRLKQKGILRTGTLLGSLQAALNLAGSLTCSGRDVRDLFEMGTPVLYNCVTCRTKVKIAKSAREARSFSTGRARAKKGQGSRSGLRSWITVSCNCASRARPATQVQKAYCSHEATNCYGIHLGSWASVGTLSPSELGAACVGSLAPRQSLKVLPQSRRHVLSAMSAQ